MNIPEGPHALTPEWLTDVLQDRGIINKVVITSIDVEAMDDSGTTSQLARLRLRYHSDETSGPKSIIAKFASPDMDYREVMRLMRTYEREVRFYEEVAHTIDLWIPRCFYSQFVPETLEYVLLIEDLSPARSASWETGCSLDDAALALREIAKLHAAWWDSPQLEEKTWLFVPHLRQAFQDLYCQNWQSFLDKVGDLVPHDMRAIGDKLFDRLLKLIAPLYEPPLTISHHDFQLTNLLFELHGHVGSLAVIDWQFVTRGRGTCDVGYFLSYNIKTEDRRFYELDLLRLYHQALVDGGVRDYGFEAMLQDYRRMLLSSFAQRVVSIGMGYYADKFEVVRETMIPRTITSVLDHNFDDLL